MPIKELKLELLNEIRDLDIRVRRNALSKTLAGNFTTIFKGRGIEFSGFRKYQFGDDASMIDWPASLRAKATLVRDFEIYRNFRALIILDVGDTMLFSSTNKLKVEYAAEIAYTLAYSMLRSDNAVGFSMMGSDFKMQVPIRIGLGNLKLVRNYLVNTNNYGGHFEFENMVKSVMSYMKSSCKIFIVSDFLGMKENWWKYLQGLAFKFDVTGIMIRDVRDQKLPEKSIQLLVEDPSSGEKLYVDTKQYAKKYEKFVEEEEKLISNFFKKSKAGFIKLNTNEDYNDKLIKFFATYKGEA